MSPRKRGAGIHPLSRLGLTVTPSPPTVIPTEAEESIPYPRLPPVASIPPLFLRANLSTKSLTRTIRPPIRHSRESGNPSPLSSRSNHHSERPPTVTPPFTVIPSEAEESTPYPRLPPVASIPPLFLRANLSTKSLTRTIRPPIRHSRESGNPSPLSSRSNCHSERPNCHSERSRGI